MTWLHKILRSENLTAEQMLQKIMQMLKENPKLSVNEKDENGFSPLFIAKTLMQCGQPYQTIFNYLEKCGAVYNENDEMRCEILIRDSKQGLVVDIYDVARCLNPELVEMYPQAVKPEHLIFADRLPYQASVNLRSVKLVDAEKEIRKKWCTTYMVPKGLHSVSACDDLSGTTIEGMKVITSPYNKLIFAKMDKFGWGVFASHEEVVKDVMFFYGGALEKKSEKHDVVYSIRIWSSILNCHLTPAQQDANKTAIMNGKGEYNAVLNAGEVFNYMSMLQHLISADELNKLKFKIPNMDRIVAVSNINIVFTYCGGRIEQLFVVTKKIEPHHIVGMNYGDDYWRSKKIVPAIFDTKGRYISPAFYQNRRIDIIVNKTTYVFLDNHVLEETAKQQGESEYYILKSDKGVFTVSRQWLIDQDIISAKPQCVTKANKIEELELAFRTAAAQGDFNTIRYLLEWHQPKIDINAVNKGEKSSKKTALHQAVSNGHYYLVLYLLMQGASPDLKDSEQKMPAQYTSDPEILQAISQYCQAEVEKSKKNSNSAATLLSAVGLHQQAISKPSEPTAGDQVKSVNERPKFTS